MPYRPRPFSPGASSRTRERLQVRHLVLAWSQRPWPELRKRVASPAALLTGAFAFIAISSVGRVETFGEEFATRSRYAHIIVALLAVPIALAADAIARRSKVMLPVLVATTFLFFRPG